MTISEWLWFTFLFIPLLSVSFSWGKKENFDTKTFFYCHDVKGRKRRGQAWKIRQKTFAWNIHDFILMKHTLEMTLVEWNEYASRGKSVKHFGKYLNYTMLHGKCLTWISPEGIWLKVYGKFLYFLFTSNNGHFISILSARIVSWKLIYHWSCPWFNKHS